VALGIVGFLYFKPKTKGNTTTVTPNTVKPSTATPSTAVSTAVKSNVIAPVTPKQIVEDVTKLAEAKKLTTEINNLKNTRNKLNVEITTALKSVGQTASTSLKQNQVNTMVAQIKKLTEDLAKLGYVESGGTITAIIKK
jgi:hypothetical protein